MSLYRLPAVLAILCVTLSCTPSTFFAALITTPLPPQSTLPPAKIAFGGETGSAYSSVIAVLMDPSIAKFNLPKLIKVSGKSLGLDGKIDEDGEWAIDFHVRDDGTFWTGFVRQSGVSVNKVSTPPGYETVGTSQKYDEYFIFGAWDYDSTAIARVSAGSEVMTLISPREYRARTSQATSDSVWVLGAGETGRYYSARTGRELVRETSISASILNLAYEP